MIFLRGKAPVNSLGLAFVFLALANYHHLMSLGDLKVALVHDELVRRGGAEHVLEALLRLFPQADVYALYASNTPQMTADGKTYDIHTTFLQSFPLWFRRHPRRLVALLPHAAERLDLSNYDLVISSSSAFAKAVITRSNIPHVCYCHTPTRYLWERKEKGLRAFGQHFLRLADFAAAQRPDVYIANSRYTQQRIWRYYRRESSVVYPPIRTSFFTPLPIPRLHFLAVGRLTRSKQFEQAILVCEKLGLPLRIVGVGQDYRRLKQLAGKHTTFLGKLSDDQLREQYRGARALLQPGVEDFGMAAAEALACGTPVIAIKAGGVREIVINSKLGILYREQHPELLAEALRQLLERNEPYDPATLQQAALNFSQAQFTSSVQNIIEEVLVARQN